MNGRWTDVYSLNRAYQQEPVHIEDAVSDTRHAGGTLGVVPAAWDWGYAAARKDVLGCFVYDWHLMKLQSLAPRYSNSCQKVSSTLHAFIGTFNASRDA